MISTLNLTLLGADNAQQAATAAMTGSSSRTLLLLLAIFAPLATGLLTLFYPRKQITLRVLTALSGAVISFLLLLNHIQMNGVQSIDAATGPIAEISWMPILHLNLAFLTDGLGLFFALLVSGVGALIILYARGYFGKNEDDLYRFYPTLGFFTSAMIGVVLADYMLLTLLFWELTSISSFLLIGWDRYDKHAVKLAMQAFVTTGMGGMGLFGGILLFGMTTDVWTWSHFVSSGWWENASFAIALNNPILWAFLLMFFGAATKSAQFPWQYWLPGAMAAPTPVSAFLHSATMVKAGVFLTGRLLPVFGGVMVVGADHENVFRAGLEIWPWLVTIIGGFTMVLGALLSINQHDLKRIFAYTTVSQLGLLICMYGLGSFAYTHDGHVLQNIDFDITQIANHAFYKAPLFILAGALGHVLSRNITELNGAIKKHPAMCITIILAGYGLAAGPGTISFQAKELFLYAIYHLKYTAVGNWWMLLMAAAIVTATCNVAIFIRLTTTLIGLPGGYTADPNAHEADHHHHEHEHGLWASMIWVPGAILVSFQYIGGFVPSLWMNVFGRLEAYDNNYFAEGIPTFWGAIIHGIHDMSVPLMCSGIAIVCGILLGFSPIFRGVVKDVCDKIYPGIYWLAVTGGGRAFRVIQTGNMRHYTVMVLVAFLSVFYLVASGDAGMIDIAVKQLGSVTEFMPGVFLGVIICATALSLPLVSHRIIRILLLGSCGFTVVAMYLVYQAPDLALTQLTFEIISVVLFVLVIRLLPRDAGGKRPSPVWRIGLGVLAGLAFGWMTLVAVGVEPAHKLGTYFPMVSYQAFVEDVYNLGRGGGGKNIVNVILVDFRGFDTLGEITVLSLAALGVWSLLPSRRSRKSS